MRLAKKPCTIGVMVTKKRAGKRASRPAPRPAELDDLNLPGNDEHDDESVAVTLAAGGVAGLVPESFGRLSSDERGLCTQLISLVGRRRWLAREIDDLVQHMRHHGLSWGVVGWCVGTSSEAARQRWSEPVRRAGGV